MATDYPEEPLLARNKLTIQEVLGPDAVQIKIQNLIVEENFTSQTSRVVCHFNMLEKDIIIEDLEESVRDVTEGKKTVEAHKELVDKLKPIRPFESSPSITEPEEIPFVLRANKLYDKDGVVKENAGVYQLNKNIKDGEFIETRLDIPAYLDFDKWVAVLTRTSQGKKENIYSKNVTN